jgi:hypothetical protein
MSTENTVAPTPQVQYSVQPGADGQLAALLTTHTIVGHGLYVQLVLPADVELRPGAADRIWAAARNVARDYPDDCNCDSYDKPPCHTWYYLLGDGKPYVASADCLRRYRVSWLEPAEVSDLERRVKVKGPAVIAAVLGALHSEVADSVAVDEVVDSPRSGWVLADYPVLPEPEPPPAAEA